MSTLTGVVIGCGAIAREHLAALGKLPDVRVAGVCDLSPAKAEATAERFGIAKWFDNPQAMLREIKPDLIHITTPPSSHVALAKMCLEAGLNVLCEKPITPTYNEFRELRAIAGNNKCMLMEDQNLRYHSSVKRIKDLLASQKMGRLTEIEISVCIDFYGPGSPYTDTNVPHFGAALPAGVIGDFLPHIAYLLNEFLGHPTWLKPHWDKLNPNSPLKADEFRCLLGGAGATGYVSFSGNSRLNGFWIRVKGTEMQAEANLFETPRFSLRRFRSGEPALMTTIDGVAEARAVFGSTLKGLWRKLGGVTSYDGLYELIKDTYAAIGAGAPQPISIDSIDETTLLVEQFTKDGVTK